MDALAQRIESGGPRGPQLLIEEVLRQFWGVDTGETVVGLFESYPMAQELAAQPFAAVQTHLHVKREIGLKPQVHEAEVRVEVILVNVEALARPQLQTAFLELGRAMILEAHARFDGFERADQSRLRQGMLVQQGTGEILFAGSGRLKVQHGPLAFVCFRQCGILHTLRGLLSELPELHEPHAGPVKEPVDAAMTQRAQGSAENEPIESREHTADERALTRSEFFHGASSFGGDVWPTHHRRYPEGAPHIQRLGCGRQPALGANRREIGP